MAKPPRHVPRDTSRRRVWVYVAVATFVAADLILIVLALGSTRATDAAEVSRPIPTFSAASAVDAAAAPTPTATPTATPAATTVLPLPPTRLLDAVDGQTAWRAQTGPCPATPASPELTTNGGATWKKTDATGTAKVTALQSLMVTSESVVEMVGLAKSDCAPQFVKTFVSGDNYSSYSDKLAGTWFVDPADRATIHSPSGSAKAPCDAVVTLAVRDDKSAAALCADGRLFSTVDAAAWSPASALPGVVSITDTDTGYLAAAVGRSECAGVQLITLAPARESTEAGCFKAAVQPSGLTGNIAVSGAVGTVWLWAGDAFVRSSDGGATWN
ncbi:hypothetical protein E3O19_13785 [Cryobacterium algoritolerans]|uniref:Exo-alpha-sialidase n=1 Tax=Cryobacterium algoritolerans TaxID=1259184 RepID=A0A4R8WKW5_9MICO|nr:hypothetical protein [Cryobacterium algoritolerans]TFC12019.1 hypothetical protein E3O19_13785 [Cryobacterium algoritolerans]